jgi:glucose-6-phosphate 1-dehydrogenase
MMKNKTLLIDAAAGLIKDVLDNHLPQLKADLEKDVPSEHQALTILDHLIRARSFREAARKIEEQ